MIYVFQGIGVEIKWKMSLCSKFIHNHIDECGTKDYYWRFADELNSIWRGPFGSLNDVEESAHREIREAKES